MNIQCSNFNNVLINVCSCLLMYAKLEMYSLLYFYRVACQALVLKTV